MQFQIYGRKGYACNFSVVPFIVFPSNALEYTAVMFRDTKRVPRTILEAGLASEFSRSGLLLKLSLCFISAILLV